MAGREWGGVLFFNCHLSSVIRKGTRADAERHAEGGVYTAAKAILDAAKRFLDAAVWIAKETYLPDKKTKNPNCLSNSDS